MTEERFKGCLKGYSYRQRVVHEVRQQYEEIVSQLQPLEEESVHWPSEHTLCYPHFKSQGDCDSTEGPTVRESQDNRPDRTIDEEKDEKKDDTGLKDVTDQRDSASNGLKDVIDQRDDVADQKDCASTVTEERDCTSTVTEERDCTSTVTEERDCTDGIEVDEAGEIESEVFKSLHMQKDRDSLSELRSKLAMELLWLKQAIESRQKYIQLKKEMELPTQ